MPIIGFTVFKDKLLNGQKCQTVRRPRKRPLRVGDRLIAYWRLRTKECEKLGETKIMAIQRKTVREFTEADAEKDGFEKEATTYRQIPALEKMLLWFVHKYPDIEDDWQFDIITFSPLTQAAGRL